MGENTKQNTKKKKMVGGTSGKGFDVLGQPSPESKSAGWDRRREKHRILDLMMEFGDMTYKEIVDFVADVKVNPNKYTVREVKLANYVLEEKFTTDWLDRNIGKATQDIDITTDGDKITGIEVNIVGGSNETKDTSD